MNNILFALLFIYLTNWQATIALFHGYFTSRTKSLPYVDKKLIEKTKRKTGITFHFKKAVADYYNGFSLLVPFNTIVLSSKLIDDMNTDELEWIVLHEAGHRLFLHGVKSVVITILFVLSGIYLLRFAPFFLVALISAILYQQIHRYFEYQADSYAAKTMDNPKGMITANKKFAEKSTSTVYKISILRVLFTPHLSYDERIKIAQHFLHS